MIREFYIPQGDALSCDVSDLQPDPFFLIVSLKG
jgi:hypothetical protein